MKKIISKSRKSERTNLNPFSLNNETNKNNDNLNSNQLPLTGNIEPFQHRADIDNSEQMDTLDETVTHDKEDEFENFFEEPQGTCPSPGQGPSFENFMDEIPSFEVISINDSQSRFNQNSFIFTGSPVLTKEAAYYVFAFITRFNLDAVCCGEFLKVIQFMLPLKNSFPKTMNALEKIIGMEDTLVNVKEYCQTCRLECRCFGPLKYNQNELDFCQCTINLLDFDHFLYVNVFDKLTYIVQNYFETIQSYLLAARDSLDIVDGNYYKKIAKAKTLHLIICADGTPIRKSSKRKQFWPVILSLVELPRALRDSIKNKIICGKLKKNQLDKI
jgi:hypothetical protein